MVANQSLKNEGKGNESDAAHGGAGAIEGDGLPCANISVHCGLLLSLPLVLLNQGCARGKNRRKRQKEPADCRTIILGDDASGSGDQSPEYESHQELMPIRLFDR